MDITNPPYCEIFLAKDGWRWRLKAQNGEIGAMSEAYSDFRSCRAWAAAWTNRILGTVPIVYPPDVPYAQAERQGKKAMPASAWRRILRAMKFRAR